MKHSIVQTSLFNALTPHERQKPTNSFRARNRSVTGFHFLSSCSMLQSCCARRCSKRWRDPSNPKLLHRQRLGYRRLEPHVQTQGALLSRIDFAPTPTRQMGRSISSPLATITLKNASEDCEIRRRTKRKSEIRNILLIVAK